MVQVERIADRGTLNVRQVKIPSLMDFAPIIKDTPRLMDERVFRPEPMVLKEDLLTLTLEERLTYDAAENLFFVNFEGYAVQTGQEVEDIKDAVEKIVASLNQKVYTIVNYRSRYLAFAIVPKQAVYTRIATILQNNLTLIFINIQINYNLKNFVLINI